MSCCCENPLNIGCFCVGKGLTLNFLAPADGLIYTLNFRYLSAYIAIYSEPTIMGEPVVFNTEGLNPFFTYVGELLDENDEQVILYDADGGAYDCIKISPRTQGKKGQSIDLFLTPQ